MIYYFKKNEHPYKVIIYYIDWMVPRWDGTRLSQYLQMMCC